MTTLGAILPSPLPLRDAHLLAAHVGQFAHERWFDAWPPAEQDRWRAVTRFAAMAAFSEHPAAMARASMRHARETTGTARQCYRLLAWALFRAARWPS